MQCPYCKEDIADRALDHKKCCSLSAAAPAMEQNDFNVRFYRAMALWKGDILNLAILTLVLMLVAWILAAKTGLDAWGTDLSIKAALGDGKAQAGGVFSGRDCFANLLLFFLINLIAYLILHFMLVMRSRRLPNPGVGDGTKQLPDN